MPRLRLRPRLTAPAVLLTTALTLGALMFGAAPAMADDGPTVGNGSGLATLQQAGALATQKRIDALTRAESRIDGSKLEPGHAATIRATFDADLAAMHDLQSRIAGATTAAEARPLYRQIFTDYRVFAVALPQAHYAAAADRLTSTTVPKLQRAHDALAAKAGGTHADELAELQANIDAVSDAVAGLADTALAVTPADHNANPAVLTEVRTTLKTAVAKAKAAAAEARAIMLELR